MTEWGKPYWWEGAPPAGSVDELTDACDILIIGAGYTGLAAAIAARDSGASVCVVDAGVPGEGASTRNGGMFGAHPRLPWAKLAHLFGEETADALFAEASTALEWARRLIDAEGIDARFQQTGRVQLAWSRAHFEAQKVLAEKVSEKSAVEVRVLDRDALAKEIDTPLYFGGLLFPEHGAIDPARFHAGLMSAARKRGIPIVSNCAVENLRRVTGGYVAEFQRPRNLRCEKVVLATNGYTGGAFPWFRRRVFPVPSFIIATEPLPEDQLATLAPGRRMMVETRARHSYFRISPDGSRILFGGRAAMVGIDIQKAAARQLETMLEVWPSLRGVKLTHAWTGNTGFSFAHMPHVGQRDGIHFSMGYSGSGTVLAPYLGAKAGYQAAGDPRGETAYSRTYLPWRAYYPFGPPLFMRVADVWYRQWVDRSQNRARARDLGSGR